MARTLLEGEVLPHPAEDLSADDDLLSWILVDQLGCLPNTKLGVHPQQVKFVGPPFKTSEILAIVHENVVNTNLPEAMRRLLDFHLIKGHLETKVVDRQRERFVQHLRRYLLPLLPTSRIEIFTTDRYSFVTGHVELAVYATRPLSVGDVLQELQGSVVPLPDAWRDEMDIGEDYALGAGEDEENSEEESVQGEEGDEGGDDQENRSRGLRDSTAPEDDGRPASRKGRRKREPRGARRSDRTKRRDFSIVWSNRDRCYNLFLGPARFLNHDCNPNVALLRQGKYVTFRVLRPIRIGEEVTTHYGDDYFGKANVECLCLTCEKHCRGGFTGQTLRSEAETRSLSPSMSSVRLGSPASTRKPVRPSALRHALSSLDLESQADEDDQPVAGPSRIAQDVNSDPTTPRKPKPRASLLSVGGLQSPATDASRSEIGSPSDDQPQRRERYQRKAATNAQHFDFRKRPRKSIPQPEESLVPDEENEDCVRCATCAKALHERIWFNNKYFDHCARCVRHSLIFDLPWPAHTSAEVLDYPPSHLIPHGYIPPRVSSIALPSLDKNRKKHVEPAPVSPVGESHQDKRARKFRDELALEDLRHEQLREAAWTAQHTAEEHARAVEQAKEEAKRRKLETKRARDENKIKGSGVWQRYEYISEEELQKREAAKHAVTSGTRRGGRFRADADEAEARLLAEQVVTQRLGQLARDRDSGDDNDNVVDTGEERQAGDVDNLAPNISPIRPVPKIEPADSAKKINKPVMHVIEIGDTSDEDGDDIMLLEDFATTQMITKAVNVTQNAAKSGRLTQPINDSDDDCVMVESPRKPSLSKSSRSGHAAETHQNGDNSKARITASAPLSKSSPAGPSRPRVSVSTSGADVEGKKRGRGRPKDSGKLQKAAARKAGQQVNDLADDGQHTARQSGMPEQARPSIPTRTVNGMLKSANDRKGQSPETTHILTSIEKRLSASSCKYSCFIESLGDQGELCWKSIGAILNKQSDADDMLELFMEEEHFELQTHLSERGTSIGSTEAEPIARLPGHRTLVSSAEVKAWSEMRGSTADLPFEAVPMREPPRLQERTTPGIEIIGLLLDSHTTEGYFRPSDTAGPWKHGQYRMVATLEVTDATKPLAAGEILGKATPTDSTSPIKRKVPAPLAPDSSPAPQPIVANIPLPSRPIVPKLTPASISAKQPLSFGGLPPPVRRPSLHGWPANKVSTDVPQRFLSQTASILLNRGHAPKTNRTPAVAGILVPSEFGAQGEGHAKDKGRANVGGTSSHETSTTVSPAEAEVEAVLNGNGKRKLSPPGSASRKKVSA